MLNEFHGAPISTTLVEARSVTISFTWEFAETRQRGSNQSKGINKRKGKERKGFRDRFRRWVLLLLSSPTDTLPILLIQACLYTLCTGIAAVPTRIRAREYLSSILAPPSHLTTRKNRSPKVCTPTTLCCSPCAAVTHHFSYLEARNILTSSTTADIFHPCLTSTMCHVDWIVERQPVPRPFLFSFMYTLFFLTSSLVSCVSLSLSPLSVISFLREIRGSILNEIPRVVIPTPIDLSNALQLRSERIIVKPCRPLFSGV